MTDYLAHPIDAAATGWLGGLDRRTGRLDAESQSWFNGGMEITVLFENSDYDLIDVEDQFDWYRQADEIPTLDYGLHMVWGEAISPWRAQ